MPKGSLFLKQAVGYSKNPQNKPLNRVILQLSVVRGKVEMRVSCNWWKLCIECGWFIILAYECANRWAYVWCLQFYAICLSGECVGKSYMVWCIVPYFQVCWHWMVLASCLLCFFVNTRTVSKEALCYSGHHCCRQLQINLAPGNLDYSHPASGHPGWISCS